MLKQTIQNLRTTLDQLTLAQNAAAQHAKNGQSINEFLSDTRESLLNDLKDLYADTGNDFPAVLGELLAQQYEDTDGKDKGRTAFRKAQSRGLEIVSGRFLETVFPRKWDSLSTVQVRLVEREETSQLDKLKGELQHLNNGDLNSLIVAARGLVTEREEAASSADSARQLIAAAMAEENTSQQAA